MKSAQSEIRNSKLNKENIDSNFKNIVNSFSTSINNLTSQVDKLKENQQKIAQPMVEYCDMLTKEYAHLNEQTNNTKDTIHSMFKGLNNSLQGAVKEKRNTKSANHSDSLPMSTVYNASSSGVVNNRRQRRFVTEVSLNNSVNGNEHLLTAENMILPKVNNSNSITNTTPYNKNKFSED